MDTKYLKCSNTFLAGCTISIKIIIMLSTMISPSLLYLVDYFFLVGNLIFNLISSDSSYFFLVQASPYSNFLLAYPIPPPFLWTRYKTINKNSFSPLYFLLCTEKGTRNATETAVWDSFEKLLVLQTLIFLLYVHLPLS